jgi:low temperature requirement protein LtrA
MASAPHRRTLRPFTIIVLGESLTAATLGVQAAWNDDATIGSLAPTVVGGLLIVFSMWWLYFEVRGADVTTDVRDDYLTRGRGILAWGYGHYLVFASAAAVGAGLDIAVGHSSTGSGDPSTAC